MTNHGEQSPKVRLSRPEAQAFDYERLTDSQRKAVGQILKILDDAQKELDNTRRERDCSDVFPGLIPVPEKNSNRVLLLSGGRGSGKTSVLYSLIKFLVDDDVKCCNPHGEHYEECKKFFEKCKDASKKFIWLQPLEMETLPPSTNLLAAILNRIDEAVSRFRGSHPKTHQCPPAYSPYHLNQDEHDVMLDFTKLQQDVALAWDGNIEKHAVNVDPDVYAVEVLRAEQKRLRLKDRIEKCLDNLHKLFIKSYNREKEHLFVLPIDDFDLNPHRCLELVRLIRILNVPRLFTLILGDIWLIRNFLNFKYFQSIGNSGSNQESTLPNIRYDECELAHNLSGGANRKLFAMTSIIPLKQMKIDEVFKFRQTKGSEINQFGTSKPEDPKIETKPEPENCNFEDFLIHYINRIDINTAYYKKEEGEKSYCFGNLKIKKQHDLFNQKVDAFIEDEKCESKSNYFYIRNELYQSYPRLVQDIWLRMYIDAKEKKIDKTAEYYMKHAERIYKARIRQERSLTTGSSIFLNGILRKNFQDKLRLDISALDLVYTYGQPLIFQHEKAFINILHPEDWYVKLTHPLKSSGTPDATENVILNAPTAAALIFMHDLLAFSDPVRIAGNNLMLKNGTPLWAYTQWPFGSDNYSIKVPWHFPPWQTMFECDLLRRCWIEVWEWSNRIGKNNKDIKDAILIDSLVYLWLRIITNILSKPENFEKISLRTKSFDEDGGGWKKLLSHIGELDTDGKDQTKKKREQIIHGWFVAIGCMMAPETNVPKKIRKFFSEQKIIDKILIRKKTIIAGGIRKLRARSAVLFFDNGALGLLKDLFNPRKKAEVKLEKIDDNNNDEDVDNDNNEGNEKTPEDFINYIGNNCLCPFVEDIVMLSKLNYRKKKEYEEKLLNPMKSDF